MIKANYFANIVYFSKNFKKFWINFVVNFKQLYNIFFSLPHPPLTLSSIPIKSLPCPYQYLSKMTFDLFSDWFSFIRTVCVVIELGLSIRAWLGH